MGGYRNLIFRQLDIYFCKVCTGINRPFYCLQGILHTQIAAPVTDGQRLVDCRRFLSILIHGQKAGGKEQQVWPTQLIVPTGERMGVFAAIFKLVYTLAFGVLALAALVAFVCFVRNANRDDIFTRKNIRLLRVVGWCLFAAGTIVTADGFYDIHMARQAFSLGGYVVDYGSAADFTNIIFGLFTLVIAEAFAIGLRMKEEQELTI